MPTPAWWLAVLDYVGEDPWREQLDRDGPTDSRLSLSPAVCCPEDNGILVFFEPRTYIASCMAFRIVLLVDAITLRENNAHVGVDRKDRCVLVLLYRAFHNGE
ncbi:hypothetical protein TNIN_366221 [Trichonephila inaurata madagascariensis]|uniref:Uncharacterized protein n=1 Tax=Trichonephila inaurata madagascariensis TaxID=2747483 RepID=A0A8X7BZL7_9ARAC|nr:hypothetical protein TNIN_366221 [Trichonephila inaurata madagascariensis]